MIVCWFSCGAASFCATKLILDKYGKENVRVLDLLATHYYVEERKNCMLRCVKDLSDCVKESDENVTQEGLCNIDDMQAEIDRLREALEFYAKEEHLKIDTRGNMKNKEDWEICGEADNYWNNGDKKYFYCEDGYKARKALNSKARENVN